MSEYGDIYVGKTFGYYEILETAGRNDQGQQLYKAKCSCCGKEFIKVISSFKRAVGQKICKHKRMPPRAYTKEHPCLYCGKPTKNLVYCSNSCKTAAINQSRKRQYYCEYCGKRRPDRKIKYCSSECRRLGRLQKIEEGIRNGQENSKKA